MPSKKSEKKNLRKDIGIFFMSAHFRKPGQLALVHDLHGQELPGVSVPDLPDLGARPRVPRRGVELSRSEFEKSSVHFIVCQLKLPLIETSTVIENQ